jgi:prevent-host-death family protein
MHISAGEFKAKCLKLMDEVRNLRTEVIITKFGKPVAKLVPVQDKSASLFGCLKGSVEHARDLVAPTGESWDADA